MVLEWGLRGNRSQTQLGWMATMAHSRDLHWTLAVAGSIGKASPFDLRFSYHGSWVPKGSVPRGQK